MFVQQFHEVCPVGSREVTIAARPVPVNSGLTTTPSGRLTISLPVTAFRCLVTEVPARQDLAQTIVSGHRLDRIVVGRDVQAQLVVFK
jgi:hypothetical protein